ncbi:hypothetical protein [Maribacter aestuarii]|uniref:hypothetical protein n=1 Tax=Maribacter aestuarii TaxID=1130723 RepID=UPI00248AE67D|nr:hypothetical protein [Maribacter aestuarii]
MTTELTKEIRDILNHPWKRELLFQDRVKWNKIWASLDTFDDTHKAITHYLNLDEFGPNDGGYLYIYGVLQAINLQQDALKNLLSALFDKTIDWETEYPDLYKIREHRNDSIGHPSKRGNDKSFHMIGRYSISKVGFTLASYFPKSGDKSKFEKIDLLKCIESQSRLLNVILTDTMNELTNEFKEHKKKFKGDKIRSKIPSTYDYHISKLFEHAYGNYPVVDMNFKIVKETIDNIKAEVTKRYFRTSALQGLEDTLNLIEYILKRLEKTLIQNKISDENELRIFIQSLRQNSQELFDMVDEIDTEFR